MSARKLAFALSTRLAFSGPVHSHAFLLRVLPANRPGQTVLDVAVRLDPGARLAESPDVFGNRTLSGRIDEPHDHFDFHVEGTVLVDASVPDTRLPAPYLRHPTPLTRMGEALAALASQLPSSGTASGQASALMDRVRQAIAYTPKATTVRTTAEEAVRLGKGVCQDYSHAMLALLRARQIPCRYTSGLFLGEGASHAWIEFWDGSRWVGIDPTNGCSVNDTYIKIAQGADYADCPLDNGVFSGFVRQDISVQATVSEAKP